MNAWKVILSTLVIFIAGIVTGIVLVTFEERLHPKAQPRPVVVKTNAYNNAGGNNPWMMRNVQLLRRMDRELDLTPEQHTHIEAIIKESQERIKGLMRSVQPLMNKEMQETRSEIIKELTPEQQKKFEDFPHHPNAERRHGETNTAPINQSATGTNSVSTNAP